MSAELLQILFESSLAASVATLLVLAMRRPLRRVFGARTAYALWWLVPVALLAVALPSPRSESTLRLLPRTAEARSAPADAATATGAPFDADPWIALAWGLGATATVASLLRRQRRFRRQLGPLHVQPDGHLRAQTSHAGPAVIGALRGRVVLPADFDVRYTPLQRELVLCHERVHIARFDLSANLVASALRCLHWFNPLLHYAVARFRFDQELAADALVLAQRPEARRAYADAMLGTSLMSDTPPLGCHWQSAHPLKERIAMLKLPLPGAARRLAGLALAAGLSLAVGFAAWATQPAAPSDMRIDENAMGLRITLSVDGRPVLLQETLPTLGKRESFVQDSTGYGLDYTVRSIVGDVVTLDGTVTRAGEVLSRPQIAFRRGQAASVTVEGATLEFFYGTARELLAEPRASIGAASHIAPTYARLAAPAYPQPAIDEKVEGVVLLRVLVGVDGSPAKVEVETSSGDARLDESARGKVTEWRFNPAMERGQPIERWVRVPVTFALDGPGNMPAKPALPADALDEIYINAPKG